ncbi:MAG: hypothetical protein RLZZ210_1272 [Pseudomonadota bacterium]|jgi:hypothetical protein
MFFKGYKMQMKLLMGLLISLSVFSTNTVLAASNTKAKKAKTYQKKSYKSKKSKNSSKKDSATNVVEEKLGTIEYKCEDNQKFTLLGKVDSDNNVTVNFAGSKVILTRVDTDTGANRFTNQDKGFDLVTMPSKSMLMNTKSGRRLADNCHAPADNAGQVIQAFPAQ